MIGRTISHYRILRRLGEGGMGVVYVAEDLTLGRYVAVKLPVASSEEKDYRARFLREARAVSALSHQHIAAVYDCGQTEEGQPFIVMELVSGRTLGELLQESALTLVRSVEIVVDVAEALGEAHRHNIVHRDVKPSNVMINDRGQVKVLDFGLAKQLDTDGGAATLRDGRHPSLLTRSDVVVGTPMYLSPEQARGATVDGRSDLFSLGALLYECVAGRPPFSGANVIEIGGEVLHVNPPPPSKFNPRVPAELDRATMKALAKKPEARYQTADEMAADLRAALARLSRTDTARTRRLAPPSSGRSSMLQTISENLRRPRISPAAFFGAILLVLLSVWAYARWSAPSAHRPKPEAVQEYTRGADLMRQGAYYQASRALQRAVEIDDRYALARAALAEAWSEMDYFEKAHRELVAVSALVPDQSVLDDLDALYLDAIRFTALRRFPEAAESYRRIASAKPKEPQVYVDLGRAYERNEEPEKAIANYHEALKISPRYATAHLRLGVIYGRQQEMASALNNFKMAEELYGDGVEGRTEVLYQRGFVLQNNGKTADAARDLQQALELTRGGESLYQRIRVQLALSGVLTNDRTRHDEAEGLAREAIELASNNQMEALQVRGYVDLGNVYLARGSVDESEKYYTQALELARKFGDKRNEARALVSLGNVYTSRANPDETLKFVRPALDYYRQNKFRREVLQCYTLIGRALRQKGDYASALATFQDHLREAKELNNRHQMAQAYGDIGRVHTLRESYHEALVNLEEAYQIQKAANQSRSIANNLANRAEALIKLGRHEEARALLAEAESLGGQPGANKVNRANILYLKAEMALAEGQFAEARALAEETVEAAGAQYAEASVSARRILCLARALAPGGGRAGLGACREASKAAEQAGDHALRAQARLALAEALLEAGQPEEALERASEAEGLFARNEQSAARWRALLVAARASARLGRGEEARRHAEQARDLLAALAGRFGEHHRTYLSRPDVQTRRQQLDELLAAH